MVDAPPPSNTLESADGRSGPSSRRMCSGTMPSSPTGIEAHSSVPAALPGGRDE